MTPLYDLEKYLDGTGIDRIQRELIRIRASQINNCAYCLSKHIKDYLKYGGDPDKVQVLSAWREVANWFSEEEQLILQITEEITRISDHGLSDESYQKAIALFGEVKTVQLVMAMVSINALNRVAVPFHLAPVKSTSTIE